MSINAVNYNPDNFEEPETFKPHRWHSDAGKHSPEKFNINTFGAGPVMGNVKLYIWFSSYLILPQTFPNTSRVRFLF